MPWNYGTCMHYILVIVVLLWSRMCVPECSRTTYSVVPPRGFGDPRASTHQILIHTAAVATPGIENANFPVGETCYITDAGCADGSRNSPEMVYACQLTINGKVY